MRGLSVVLAILTLLPCPALAGSIIQPPKPTLADYWKRAKVVVYGTLANPRITNQVAETGITDLHIEQVLKPNPALGNVKLLKLDRYIRIPDPEKPVKHLVFFTVNEGKLEPLVGKQCSPALLTYVKAIQLLGSKSRLDSLRFYLGHLEHEDPAVAEDALAEISRSKQQVADLVPKHLSAEKLRRWIKNPETSSEGIGLYAFLLGGTGEDSDARLLGSLINEKSVRITNALDDILAGYIRLRPTEGWDLAENIVTKGTLLRRFSVVRMYRFYYDWKPNESKEHVVRGFAKLIEEPQMTDIPVEQFRRWKIWDLTGKILAQYGKPGHDSAIVKNSIIRYALVCPLPESRQFIENVRRMDAELVRDIEEGLELEGKN